MSFLLHKSLLLSCHSLLLSQKLQYMLHSFTQRFSYSSSTKNILSFYSMWPFMANKPNVIGFHLPGGSGALRKTSQACLAPWLSRALPCTHLLSNRGLESPVTVGKANCSHSSNVKFMYTSLQNNKDECELYASSLIYIILQRFVIYLFHSQCIHFMHCSSDSPTLQL